LLKYSASDLKQASPIGEKAKRGALPREDHGPLASGLNRRAFLKTGSAISLLAGLAACKPDVPDAMQSAPEQTTVTTPDKTLFNDQQRLTLSAVYRQLFPDDGDGPGADDINATSYLEWAMSDEQNIQDGDPEFIVKGIGWLEDLAQQTLGERYIRLSQQDQSKILDRIAASQAGENWLALLMFYLAEALMLDPVYGGNPDQIGWRWLEHQPGFPRPVKGKTYRDFE